jgi:hypothetical protein
MRAHRLTIALLAAGTWLAAAPSGFTADSTPTRAPEASHDRDRDRRRSDEGRSREDDRRGRSGDSHGSEATATPRDSGHDGTHRKSGDDEGVRKLFRSLDDSRRSDHDGDDRSRTRSRDDDGQRDRETERSRRDSGDSERRD